MWSFVGPEVCTRAACHPMHGRACMGACWPHNATGCQQPMHVPKTSKITWQSIHAGAEAFCTTSQGMQHLHMHHTCTAKLKKRHGPWAHTIQNPAVLPCNCPMRAIANPSALCTWTAWWQACHQHSTGGAGYACMATIWQDRLLPAPAPPSQVHTLFGRKR